MAKAKNQAKFVETPGFKVSAPLHRTDSFVMDVRAVRVDTYQGVVEFQYSGEESDKSQAVFKIPDDPQVLKDLAKLFRSLARRHEIDKF